MHLLLLVDAVLERVRNLMTSDDRERGDVPGWVMVTVMTAGLVVALLALAGPKLTSAFSRAIDSVSG